MVSRRKFGYGALTLAVGGRKLALAELAAVEELVLVGTQTQNSSKGIYAYRLNSQTGELTPAGLAAETPTPSFLVLGPDARTVFAVNEVSEFQGQRSGCVTSFRLDRKAGELKQISQVSTRGTGPCHVAVDATGRCIFVANYNTGSVASFRVGHDGVLSEAVSFFQFTGAGPDRDRQTGPHAHRVTVSPNNKFVMVNDLGLDVIHIYRLDAKTAELIPNEPAVWKGKSGAGPRALKFHPSGHWAYCVSEMASTVSVLDWDRTSGALTTKQEISLLPEGFTGPTGASDIAFDASGRFAYVANRIDDFLATMTVSPVDGTLTLMERGTCGGKIPRHLALDETEKWLLVANQESDNIAVFARDRHTGKLAVTPVSYSLSRPQCFVFC